eukprot:COSAG02_NODE_52372_length_308_cov_0.741627_1_plen_39_part_01
MRLAVPYRNPVPDAQAHLSSDVPLWQPFENEACATVVLV